MRLVRKSGCCWTMSRAAMFGGTPSNAYSPAFGSQSCMHGQVYIQALSAVTAGRCVRTDSSFASESISNTPLLGLPAEADGDKRACQQQYFMITPAASNTLLTWFAAISTATQAHCQLSHLTLPAVRWGLYEMVSDQQCKQVHRNAHHPRTALLHSSR